MNAYDQKQTIEERAGVHTDACEAETSECLDFNVLVEAIKRIHNVKALGYGDYLKTHGDETPQLFAVQHFCDIKRKYVRAKTFIERMTRGEQVDFTDLLDTYSDLAVYAVMGLQMAFHCREKMSPPEPSELTPTLICEHVFVATANMDVPPGCIKCGVELIRERPDGRVAGRAESNSCIHGVLYNDPCKFCDDEIPF